MFRISMVDGLSCRARCVCESAEDILRDASIERKKCLRLDVENSCEKSRRGHGLLRKCAWRQVKVVEGAMRDRADSLVKCHCERSGAELQRVVESLVVPVPA